MPKLVVSKELVQELTIDELIALQEGDLKTLKAAYGRFVQNGDGEYLPQEEGAAIVGKMSLREIMDVANALKDQMAAVVPNE